MLAIIDRMGSTNMAGRVVRSPRIYPGSPGGAVKLAARPTVALPDRWMEAAAALAQDMRLTLAVMRDHAASSCTWAAVFSCVQGE